MQTKPALGKKAVCILLSGGLDSAACIQFYLRRGFRVTAVHIDYGQSAAHAEEDASRKIAKHYRIARTKLYLDGTHTKGPGLIHGRNAFLLFTALLHLGLSVRAIAIGIHAGTHYSDCSKSFVDSIQRVFDLYTDGSLRVATPFLQWNKKEIWEFSLKEHVPTKLTYSCEKGGDLPCGHCLSCKDREALSDAKHTT